MKEQYKPSKIINLMGPTASGKTDLAISLADFLPIEIISVDSAMVYRGMDIGTGKPTLEEKKGVPHHLIDMIDPNQSYCVSQFCNDVYKLVEEISLRGNIPLLVGGTMMYFNALKEGLSPLPSRNDEIRLEIEKEANIKGWEAMHDKLRQVDLNSANKIKPNDKQRISRALEVYIITGKSLSENIQIDKDNLIDNKSNTNIFKNFESLDLALAPLDRNDLHIRIEKRFIKMLDSGLIDEVNNLIFKYKLTTDMSSMRSVGYRQVFEYLNQHYTFKEMQYRGIVATRQLAKRQFTWLRKWTNLNWLRTHSKNLVSDTSELIKRFVGANN